MTLSDLKPGWRFVLGEGDDQKNVNICTGEIDSQCSWIGYTRMRDGYDGCGAPDVRVRKVTRK